MRFGDPVLKKNTRIEKHTPGKDSEIFLYVDCKKPKRQIVFLGLSCCTVT